MRLSPSPPQREERDGERRTIQIAQEAPLPNPLPAPQGEGVERRRSRLLLNSTAVGMKGAGPCAFYATLGFPMPLQIRLVPSSRAQRAVFITEWTSEACLPC